MKTSTEIQVAELPARLMQLLRELDQLSPNRFPARHAIMSAHT